ncbi:MAG: MoaD/ThiS family protein [Pseudomonadales bacterium]|jgi:molybdopterin synthase sulfur carrier subunit|nr:MoaD/ThiS family protein [Pseudomonadales bacterium]
MTALRVRYFAALREALGLAEESVDLAPEGLSLEALVALLQARHGKAAAVLSGPGVRIAVDQAFVEPESLHLSPGQEVAFLPPVTGG